MIGMFDLDWRTSLPLTKVERITAGNVDQRGNRNYNVVMKGGERLDLDGFAYGRLASQPLQLIPATPGIEAMTVGFDDDEPYVNRAPVIAWARCFDGSVRIVTPAGVDDGHIWKEGQGYVLMPDGSVHAVGEYLDVCRFDTLAAYVAHEVDERRQLVEAGQLAEAGA